MYIISKDLKWQFLDLFCTFWCWASCAVALVSSVVFLFCFVLMCPVTVGLTVDSAVCEVVTLRSQQQLQWYKAPVVDFIFSTKQHTTLCLFWFWGAMLDMTNPILYSESILLNLASVYHYWFVGITILYFMFGTPFFPPLFTDQQAGLILYQMLYRSTTFNCFISLCTWR